MADKMYRSIVLCDWGCSFMGASVASIHMLPCCFLLGSPTQYPLHQFLELGERQALARVNKRVTNNSGAPVSRARRIIVALGQSCFEVCLAHIVEEELLSAIEKYGVSSSCWAYHQYFLPEPKAARELQRGAVGP